MKFIYNSVPFSCELFSTDLVEFVSVELGPIYASVVCISNFFTLTFISISPVTFSIYIFPAVLSTILFSAVITSCSPIFTTILSITYNASVLTVPSSANTSFVIIFA